MNFRTFFSLVLTGSLLVPAPVFGQAPSGPSSQLIGEGGGLKLVVVEGEGAKNNIRAKTATQPVVEVQDEQGKPVPGAEVVFQLPAAGPGGVFNGWMRTQTVRTDAEGRAAASGFNPNEQEGRFNIKVTATEGTKKASGVIAQSNVRDGAGNGARSSRKKLWITLGLLGAAAAIGGGVAATRNGDSSSGPVANPISITPGPISVGSPR